MKGKETVYAFIDSQNLNLGVKSQGWKLDFKKFRVFLKDKYNVEKAYLFIGFIPDNSDLYNRLKREGFILVFKPVLQSRNYNKKIKVKGNVDAELVLHTMIQYKNYSKAIIVSGDGDFHCLVEYLDSKRKLGKIIAPNKKYSSLLRKFRKYIVHIGDFKNKIKKERD
ncbi:MAG: NYN domain-containing protein [Patescibacteria group bacterium]